ncbi:MAG: Crp/Fnr family transcriptional regulator [Pyrinomonadaceae bacterium]|nr:Crp/Fnr family transcriptional regulator [Pyrinomonadaceae bacterium]
MSKIEKINSVVGNYILASLPETEYRQLLPHLQTLRMTSETLIYQTGERFEYVYFPTTAMFSWIAMTRDGERVEVGVVGWEGIVGVPEILGYRVSPFAVEIELPGEAIRIKVEKFRSLLNELPLLQTIAFRYTYTAMTQLAQSSVCNRFHTVEERMTRWLLMAHDRTEGNELFLTQEILAGMIGARRPAVSIVIGNLQKSGLLRAERGKLTIIDRQGMEKTSCECYRVIREAFEQFIKNPD